MGGNFTAHRLQLGPLVGPIPFIVNMTAPHLGGGSITP